jgi:hypothetical protein
MAIPGIQSQQQRVQPQQREKRDLIDEILRGLQVAQGVTGIAVDTQKFMDTADKAKTREQIAQGKFQSSVQARKEGFGTVPEGVEGVETFPATIAGEETQVAAVADIQNAQLKQIKTAEKTAAVELAKTDKIAKDEKEATKREDSLAKFWRTSESVQDANVIAGAIQDAEKLTTNPGAISDVGLVFRFFNVLEPGGRVTEGEQATAENAGGVPSQIRNLYNRLLTEKGSQLPPQQRADIVDAIAKIGKTRLDAYVKFKEGFTGKLTRGGLNPENVMFKTTADFYLEQQRQQPQTQLGAGQQVRTPAGQPGGLPQQQNIQKVFKASELPPVR